MPLWGDAVLVVGLIPSLISILNNIRLWVTSWSVWQRTCIRWCRERYHTFVCATTSDMNPTIRRKLIQWTKKWQKILWALIKPSILHCIACYTRDVTPKGKGAKKSQVPGSMGIQHTRYWGATACAKYMVIYPIEKYSQALEVWTGTPVRTMNLYQNIRVDPWATWGINCMGRNWNGNRMA